MIRITNNMMVNDLGRNLNTNLTNMDKYQRQLSTGRRINQPSDDPSGLVKALRLRTNLTEGEQYINNIGEAINFMETTDGALNNITEILARTRELTVKAANDTNDPGAHAAIATEIRQLNEQLKMIANTTYGSKYVFGGRNVTEAPCQEDTSGDTNWVGDDNDLELEIGIKVKIPINVKTKEFFMGSTPPTPGQEGLFDLLDTLADNIEAGDTTEVSQQLGDLDVKVDDLLSKRATIGARINRLELQKSRLEDTQISYTGLLSATEDANMAEVIMNFKMQENVYRASLSAGAKIIQPSLVDFLR